MGVLIYFFSVNPFILAQNCNPPTPTTCDDPAVSEQDFIDCVFADAPTINVGDGRGAVNTILDIDCPLDLSNTTIDLNKAELILSTSIIVNSGTSFSGSGSNAIVKIGTYIFTGTGSGAGLTLNDLELLINLATLNGPVTLASVIGALPVTLTHFTARAEDAGVLLLWATATEENNDYFLLEHSLDGRKFADLIRIAGAGSTQEPQAYRYIHESPARGLNYYRLVQVDYDGAATFYDVISAEFSGKGNEWSIHPNPARDFIEIFNTNPAGRKNRATLYSITGKEVRRIPVESGTSSRMELPPGLPAGIYLLRLESGREVFTRRIMVQ